MQEFLKDLCRIFAGYTDAPSMLCPRYNSQNMHVFGKSLKTEKDCTVVEAHPCQPRCPSMADLAKAPEPERPFHLFTACSPVCPPVRSTCMGNQPPPHSHVHSHMFMIYIVIFGKTAHSRLPLNHIWQNIWFLKWTCFVVILSHPVVQLATHWFCTLRVLAPHIASHCAPWAAHIAHLGSRALRTLTAQVARSAAHMYVHMFVSDF